MNKFKIEQIHKKEYKIENKNNTYTLVTNKKTTQTYRQMKMGQNIMPLAEP